MRRVEGPGRAAKRLLVLAVTTAIVDVYLSTTLDLGYLDLEQDVRSSMSAYNGIAARNPHLQVTTSTSSEEMVVKAVSLGNPLVHGRTDHTWQSTSPHRITYASISFNTQISWNRNYEYDCWDIPVAPHTQCEADARKVSNHEFGHAEGLAHAVPAVLAVMVQDGKAPSSRADTNAMNVFRLVRITVDKYLGGLDEAASSLDPEKVSTVVALPGGTIGCHTFVVDAYPNELEAGRSYVFFLSGQPPRATLEGTTDVHEVWPVEGDLVIGPTGKIAIAELADVVAASFASR